MPDLKILRVQNKSSSSKNMHGSEYYYICVATKMGALHGIITVVRSTTLRYWTPAFSCEKIRLSEADLSVLSERSKLRSTHIINHFQIRKVKKPRAHSSAH